jgi:hypothetical protein
MYRVDTSRFLDMVALLAIAVVITIASITPLASGLQVITGDPDFYFFANKHEIVRTAVVDFHKFPFWSHWSGGGYPVLGDPHFPSLNPLIIFTLFFGSIMGLKLIGYFMLLAGGIGTFLFTRNTLGYTIWGSIYCGLMVGVSLYGPLRIADGNVTEAYALLLPSCLYLINIACNKKPSGFLLLALVIYTMFSDGVSAFNMGILFLATVCLLSMIPYLNIFHRSNKLSKVEVKPVKFLILGVAIGLILGMPRLFPMLEFIFAHGNLSDLSGHVGHSETEYPGIHGYEFTALLRILIGWDSEGLVTVGFIPIVLCFFSIIFFFRTNLIWLITLAIFTILALGANGPIDPFRYLWHLPLFNAVTNPQKYFSPEILFIVIVISGSSFNLLPRLNKRWVEQVTAIFLIAICVSFLYPKMVSIQQNTYSDILPSENESLKQTGEFYQVQGLNLQRNRISPLRSLAFFNLMRNVGTIDWYTALLSQENAIPRYWIDKEGNQLIHHRYRGEIFFVQNIDEPNEYHINENKSPESAFELTLEPNTINTQFTIETPGIIVINQNFHKDWRASSGSLLNKDGLLAVRYTEPGFHKLQLKFTSYSFFWGLAISVLGLFTLIAICWSYRSGRLNNWANHKSRATRACSRLVLRLIS